MQIFKSNIDVFELKESKALHDFSMRASEECIWNKSNVLPSNCFKSQMVLSVS